MKKESFFDKLGVMIDCSRNAVPTVSTLKKLIDLLSKMGYNYLELYTEDTYEIKERPYFGYLRGAYTGAELKEIDAYALANGIELRPCIQVLSHLSHIFHWTVFQSLRDCNDILLIDEQKTYELIEDMFKTTAENFISRNINIGCDEVNMVGLGKFLDKYGYQNRFDIINRHLGRVLEIAKKYGFNCSMWSDMFFRLIFGGYTHEADNTGEIPFELLEYIPKDVSLIYWDYYHTDIEHYRKIFAQHKHIGNPIEFAGGAWKWTGLTPDNRFSMKCADAAVAAARENQIKTMIVTAWGYDGAETSHTLFEKQWYRENKQFGFELQDARTGGLKQRLESCRRRIEEYCVGKIEGIHELDVDIPPKKYKYSKKSLYKNQIRLYDTIMIVFVWGVRHRTFRSIFTLLMMHK